MVLRVSKLLLLPQRFHEEVGLLMTSMELYKLLFLLPRLAGVFGLPLDGWPTMVEMAHIAKRDVADRVVMDLILEALSRISTEHVIAFILAT